MNLLSAQLPINLNDRGLLLVRGPDAMQFLQGQVTNDVEALAIKSNNSQTTLGAHCTHKGRMLFSFRACAIDHETIALSFHKDLMAIALEALGKYIVFSKAELIDATNQYRLVGFTREHAIPELSTLPSEPNSATHSDGITVININNDRFEAWITSEQASALGVEGFNDDDSAWDLANIIDGIGEVRPETSNEFIPQMLNLQVLANGISFTKGCYTGQEVVARMEYLGKLKRNMHPFTLTSPDINAEQLLPGNPLYSNETKQSIGNIVISGQSGDQHYLLAVVTEKAMDTDSVFLDQDGLHKLKALPLPYAITKE